LKKQLQRKLLQKLQQKKLSKVLAAALEHLVKGIVDHPEDATVTARKTNRGEELLEINVHPEDLGRVIGRGGRTAKSLRTVVKALADGKKVRVDVVDTDF
jgi:predicted RNA-binding protein YlqC (UPF0109 family)